MRNVRALAGAFILAGAFVLTPLLAQPSRDPSEAARDAAREAAAAASDAAADDSEPAETEGPHHNYGKPVEFTCPVGGEKFAQVIDAFTFPLESYPDGGGPGSEQSDVQLPECPSNGLILMNEYRHAEGDSQEAYTPAEIAKLPALIATPEYQALRKDSRAARLLWLSEKLGRPAWQRFHLLQRAAWVAKTPEDRKRWMTRIADESEALAAAPGFPPAFAIQLAAFRINALRETGRWDEALKAIDALYAKADAQRPKRPVNPHVVDMGGDDDGRIDYLERMRAVIAEKDDDAHPVGMMGGRWARTICRDIDEPGKNPFLEKNTRRGCAKLKADEEESNALAELESKLNFDAVQRDKLCVRTPADKRSAIESKACESSLDQVKWQAKRARIDAEVKKLLANPAALDPQCKAVTIGKYDTPATALGKACQDRAADLHRKESTRLRLLMEKSPAEYDRRCTYKYPQFASDDPLEEACAAIKSDREAAEWQRERKAVEAISPAELARQCAVIEAQDAARRAAEAKEESEGSAASVPVLEARAPNSLQFKCDDLKSKREEAEWQAISADPAKLAETCARAAGNARHPHSDRCQWVAEEKIDAKAYDLARDHTAMVALCQSTPTDQRDEVLEMACKRYRKCVIVPVGTRLPEKNMFRADLPVGYYGKDADKRFREGAHGDGTGQYCYETLEEANAAWELVKDPAKRVIDPVDLGEPYPDPKIKVPAKGKSSGKAKPAMPPLQM